MTIQQTSHAHDQTVSRLVDSLCTRTVSDFAAEARMDGESLTQALERYEIDYAWHVLGSDRLRNETVAVLEKRLQRAASEEQKARVAGILESAAAAQAPELLMSFDNDVAELLVERLCADGAAQQPA